jgi:hypothetical protein
MRTSHVLGPREMSCRAFAATALGSFECHQKRSSSDTDLCRQPRPGSAAPQRADARNGGQSRLHLSGCGHGNIANRRQSVFTADVRRCPQMSYGRIENLQVCDGEPLFHPSPRVVREIKIGADGRPRPELDQADFLLRAPVAELFAYFDELGNGRIALLRIQAGLPSHIAIEESE